MSERRKLVEEGLEYFHKAGDDGDKAYVRAIRSEIADLRGEISNLREIAERRRDEREQERMEASTLRPMDRSALVRGVHRAIDAREAEIVEWLRDARPGEELKIDLTVAITPPPSDYYANLERNGTG